MILDVIKQQEIISYLMCCRFMMAIVVVVFIARERVICFQGCCCFFVSCPNNLFGYIYCIIYSICSGKTVFVKSNWDYLNRREGVQSFVSNYLPRELFFDGVSIFSPIMNLTVCVRQWRWSTYNNLNQKKLDGKRHIEPSQCQKYFLE